MSKLIVEVCEVKEVKKHPNADRMAIAVVKGWNVCIQQDPLTCATQFVPGEKCVYIPYDAVLPPELANGPDDEIPGRLNVAKYCAPLPKGPDGVRPPGSRVRAARLRGERSFGIIMKIEPDKGDDPNWEVGQDVADHYGITKWEPPEKCDDGDAEKPHPRFHSYTDIDKYANFPAAIPEGEEVVFTEKVHGKNCRLGLILDQDNDGNAQWIFAAGSHTVRRKEKVEIHRRFDAVELVDKQVLPDTNVAVDQQFKGLGGKFWKVTELRDTEDDRVLFRAMLVDESGEPVMKSSDFWKFMTPEVKALLEYVRDEFEWPEPKAGIILFGEMYGLGVQDMQYGQDGQHLVAFDLAINGTYLDFDVKTELFMRFGIQQVPILYRGPFSVEKMEEYTDGNTTVCDPAKAGKFKGREGIVITPVKERLSPVLCDRAILKSVSVDYLARQGATDNR